MKLNVFLFDRLVGIIKTTSDRGIVFSYDLKYLNQENIPLSLSLPLQEKEFTQKECLPYFIGLLPEGNVKQRIAQELHVSELSTVKLLDALGGECAGTVSFFSSDNQNENAKKNKWELDQSNYTQISENEIYEMIKNIQARPLLYSRNELRLSLAGAQEKIPLAFFDNTWHLPKNGAPSTHILKPTKTGSLSSISTNEFVCMQLAKNLEIDVPETKLKNIGGISVFICKRYDRQLNPEIKVIERLHQEDFCQALGIMSDNKYQVDGGPSYTECLNLIQDHFTNPIQDSAKFLKSILFNYLIGNCDAHAKNYSVITTPEKKIFLAPFYDLVSTKIYSSLTNKMAMKLGNKYEIEDISRRDFTRQAELCGIKPRFWNDIIESFSSQIDNAFQKVASLSELKEYDVLLQLIRNQIFERMSKIIL